MYKILDTDLLEISGRQSEIIELALTYGFGGISVDLVDLAKRSQRSSLENASRFLASAKLKVASFQAPISLDDDDETFASKLEQLKGIAEVAGQCEAKVAVLDVPNGTNRLPYHEYFEVVRKRIDVVAELLAANGVRLALRFLAIAIGEDKQFKFVRTVEEFVALVRACSSKNLAVVLDTWNWHLGRGTPAHLDQIGVDRVALVYVADCKEGVDAAAATDEDRLLPGSTGVIDNIEWLKKLGHLDVGVAAFGAFAGETVTRDAFISKIQDSLNEALAASGFPVSSRRALPETLVAAAADGEETL